MKKGVVFALLLCVALVAGGVWMLRYRSSAVKSPGGFVVTHHVGVLTSGGSPPRQVKISEAGGKIRVDVEIEGAPTAGLILETHAGAEFDAKPKWFVCFDDKDVLHYGIYPQWVNRVEEKKDFALVTTLSGAEGAKVFAEVAKAFGW